MRGASLLYAALLSCITTTCLAGPMVSSPMSDRNVDASSPPPTLAETSLNKHSPPTSEQPFSLFPRARTRYAVPGSSVYIMIEVSASVVTSTDISSITDMLNGAFRKVSQMADDLLGWNALIRGGRFKFGNGPQIVVQNTNNHQVTILTLQLTLEAVFRYMRETWDYGVGNFEIFDGANMVGEGYLVTHVERPRGAIDSAGTHEMGRRENNGPHRVNVYGTDLYILIGITTQVVDQTGIENLWQMLVTAWTQAHTLGIRHGLGALIQGGLFVFGLTPKINVWNANNHQVRYAVLAKAIGAVMEYMLTSDIYGAADFAIFDGQNKVGEGVVSGSI